MKKQSSFLSYALPAFVGAGLLAFAPAHAAILADFEGGTASYDNTNPPATGTFRDTAGDTKVNISSNGAGNDFLIFTPDTTITNAVTIYDTTPTDATAATTNVFSIGSGLRGVFTLNIAPSAGTQRTQTMLGIFNPTSTATNQGVYLNYSFRSGVSTEDLNLTYLTNLLGGTGAPIADATDVNLDASPVRLVLSVKNNGNGTVDILGQLFNISALNSTGTPGTQLFADLSANGVVLGTGAGQLDIDPTTGVGIIINSFHSGGTGATTTNADNLTFTIVPEPSTGLLLAVGGVVLGLSRRRRSRQS